MWRMLKYEVTVNQVWHTSQNGSAKMVKFMMTRLKKIHDNMEAFQNANVKIVNMLKYEIIVHKSIEDFSKQNVNW